MLDIDLYKFLLRKEKFYNFELHYLATKEKKVVCYPDKEIARLKGFWVCTYSEDTLNNASAEWNIAHTYGNCYQCLKYLELIPTKDSFEYLVPFKHVIIFTSSKKFEFKENIFCFIDKKKQLDFHAWIGYIKSIDYIRKCNLKFVKRENVIEYCLIENVFTLKEIKLPKTAYLVTQQNDIISYIKVIHVTPNTAEIYIETHPTARNKGLATALVNVYKYYTYRCKKHLIYLASEHNKASLSVARKVNLYPYFTLSRLKYNNT